MKAYKKTILVAATCLFIAGIFIFIVFFFPVSTRWRLIEPTATKSYFSILTGLPVATPKETVPTVVGAMIDNFPGIVAQFGLNTADIVYEAPAEGGLTRFLAIFDSVRTVEKVGPIRSARPYFLDWIAEYNGLYLHCGGSPEALDLIKQNDIFTANEFYFGKYYWRDADISAPHNLFTNSTNWQQLWEENGERKNNWLGWAYGDLNTTILETASNARVIYSNNYQVNWRYNSIIGRYERTVSSGEDVAADNVIVLYMKISVLDDYGRLKINTIGTGDARILRDGKLIRAQWKKDNITDRTRFYQNDIELNLKPGVTWLQIVPVNSQLEITS